MTGFKPQGIDTAIGTSGCVGSGYNLKVGEIGVVVNDNDQWNGALLEIKEPLDPDGCYYSCKILIKNPKNQVVKPGQTVVWPAELIRRAATSDSTPRVDRILDQVTGEVIGFSQVRWTNKQGNLHRKDGPAIMLPAGRTEWWLNGLPHREDGPAVEYPDGHKIWKQNGNLHREGGPAVEYPDGTKQWWVNGEQVLLRASAPDSTCEIDRDGTKRWRDSTNKLHRIDGPAVERPDGSKEWRIRGKIHRELGPAILLEGFGHGSKYGGADYWYLNGVLHREDGPAVTWKDTSKFWWINGLRHREGGPAVEYADGRKEWWVSGENVIPPTAKDDGVVDEVSTWPKLPSPDEIVKVYNGKGKLKANPVGFEVTGKTAKFEFEFTEQSRGRCARYAAADQISAKISIDELLRQGRQRDLGKAPSALKPKKSWKLKAALGLVALSGAGALIFFLG